MALYRDSTEISSYRWLPLVLVGFVALAGYFGPWTPHRATALWVTGLDLGEYVKFIPQVMSGQVAIRREIFYLPLLAGSIQASLLASRRSLPHWSRLVFGLSAIPLALAMLPPAWSPGALLQPEFHLQVIAIALCLVLVPGTIITRYFPDRLVMTLIALLAVTAAVAPAWGYLQVQPAIEALYSHPLQPGWGFWSALVGFFSVAFLSIAAVFARRQQRSHL